MTEPVLFLDIDGVLNDHSDYVIQPEPVRNLNRVIAKTNCVIVLSSAWRYMIHGGAMTIKGFEYLLRSHGIQVAEGRLVGLTGRDEDFEAEPDGWTDIRVRGRQIAAWRLGHPVDARWVAVDDLPIGVDQDHLVLTDGSKGLTLTDAERLIEILTPAAEAQPCG